MNTQKTGKPDRAGGGKPKQSRMLITDISDRQRRAAGFRKVPKRMARVSFEEFLK